MARLEAELAKSRRQERTYEEANEVLQRDLDNMERELDKVKQATTAAEKQGQSTPPPCSLLFSAMTDSTLYDHPPPAAGAVDQTTTYDPTSGISHHESNLETSYLLERISSLRSAVRFLRSENAFLKSHDLVSDLDALPTNESPPTPPLTPERNSNDGFPPSRERDDGQEAEEEEGLRTGLPWMPTTNRTSSPLQPESFAVRSKRLLREARLLSCTPRLVDLRSPSAPSSTAPTSSATADSSTPPFLTGSRRRDPRNQLWAEKERARRLEWKVALLREEAGGAVAFRAPHPALHLRRTGVVA
jgi:dynactin 1